MIALAGYLMWYWVQARKGWLDRTLFWANLVLLVGYQLACPRGGILSAVGLCVPAVVVMTVVTAIYDLIKNNYWVFAALKGVQCAVVPIIGSAAISLSKEALKDKIAIGLCLAALCICLFTSISNLAVSYTHLTLPTKVLV